MDREAIKDKAEKLCHNLQLEGHLMKYDDAYGDFADDILALQSPKELAADEMFEMLKLTAAFLRAKGHSATKLDEIIDKASEKK